MLQVTYQNVAIAHWPVRDRESSETLRVAECRRLSRGGIKAGGFGTHEPRKTANYLSSSDWIPPPSEAPALVERREAADPRPSSPAAGLLGTVDVLINSAKLDEITNCKCAHG
jgi:hypothetical protein